MNAAPLKVLVIDDEPPIRKLLRMGLSTQGYAVLEAPNGKTALDLLAEAPGLIILDLGLPDMAGLDLLRTIRTRNEGVPIVVLSSRGDEAGKVRALDLGADDYVTKPFGMDELLARMRAATRRAIGSDPADAPTVGFGDITVDLAARQVTRTTGEGATTIHLTPTEWHLLEVLLRQPGRLLNQRYLLTEVWGAAYIDQPANLRLYIGQLRQKLEPNPGRPRYLITEPGMGYRFQPDSA